MGSYCRSVRSYNLCKIIPRGGGGGGVGRRWEGGGVAFGVSKRVPRIEDGAVYSVSELAAKVYRVQAGKFAGEESHHPELLCHITYGLSVQTCGLQTFVKGSE